MVTCNVCGNASGDSSVCASCQQKIYVMQLSLDKSDRPSIRLDQKDPPLKFGSKRFFGVVLLKAAYFLLILLVYGLLQAGMKRLHITGFLPTAITALPVFFWARSVYKSPGGQHALLLLIAPFALFAGWMFLNGWK